MVFQVIFIVEPPLTTMTIKLIFGSHVAKPGMVMHCLFVKEHFLAAIPLMTAVHHKQLCYSFSFPLKITFPFVRLKIFTTKHLETEFAKLFLISVVFHVAFVVDIL